MRISFIVLLSVCLFLATAAHSGKVVTSGSLTLYIRSQASTQGQILGILNNGAGVSIDCKVNGENIVGSLGTSNVWYKVSGKNGYVSSAYVSASGIPACGGGGSSFTAKARTEANLPLNVRGGASTRFGTVNTIPAGADFVVDCQTTGDTISGLSGTTNVWYHVPSKNGYVSAAFTYNHGKTAPACKNTPKPPAPSADCSGGLKTPRTCAQAVAWAEAHLTNSYNPEYAGWCDKVIAWAYGYQYSGFNSAIIHWNSTPERFRHYDRTPPPGALVFFRNGVFGHIAISTGGGNIISTDMPVAGAFGRTTIDVIHYRNGNPYIGWTNPYYHNA